MTRREPLTLVSQIVFAPHQVVRTDNIIYLHAVLASSLQLWDDPSNTKWKKIVQCRQRMLEDKGHLSSDSDIPWKFNSWLTMSMLIWACEVTPKSLATISPDTCWPIQTTITNPFTTWQQQQIIILVKEKIHPPSNPAFHAHTNHAKLSCLAIWSDHCYLLGVELTKNTYRQT